MATKGRGVELLASASTLSKIKRSLSRRIPYLFKNVQNKKVKADLLGTNENRIL